MTEINYQYIDARSREHLGLVLQVMEDFGIEVWIDQGTLLGAVRDQGFIPWDWDIDLSAWDGDWVNDPALDKALEQAGFELFFLEKSRSLRIEPIEKYPGWRQVDVHLYSVQNEVACTYFFEFDVGNGVQKNLFKLIMLLDRWQRAVLLEPPSLKLVLKKPQLLLQTGWYRGGRLRKGLFNFIKGLKHRIFLFRFNRYAKLRKVQTPVSYYKTLTRQTLLGGDYLTPERPDAYLEFKYGSGWRVPLQDYDWRNDGSVVSADLNNLNYSS